MIRFVAPHLRILTAGVLFSLGGALIKMCTFPPLERAGLRASIAAIVLFALLPEARRIPNWRVLLLLPAYFGATVLFVVANAYTTAANAIFLQATAPFWIALLAPLLLRERARRRDLAMLACIALGMSLFFMAPAVGSSTTPDPRFGDWLALGSGLSYGLLLLGFRWLSYRGSGDQGTAVAWGNAVAGPIAIALSPLFGEQLSAGDPTSWFAITALGTLQVGLAYALLTRAVRHVPAVQVSVLLMVEPALNPLLTFAVHGERPAVLAVLGGILIIGAVTAEPFLRRRQRRPLAPVHRISPDDSRPTRHPSSSDRALP